MSGARDGRSPRRFVRRSSRSPHSSASSAGDFPRRGGGRPRGDFSPMDSPLQPPSPAKERLLHGTSPFRNFRRRRKRRSSGRWTPTRSPLRKRVKTEQMCWHCDEVFLDRNALCQHQYQAHDHPCCCAYCGRHYPTMEGLVGHARAEHLSRALAQELHCWLCSHVSADIRAFWTHTWRQHKNQIIKCPRCSIHCFGQRNYDNHYESCRHKDLTSMSTLLSKNSDSGSAGRDGRREQSPKSRRSSSLTGPPSRLSPPPRPTAAPEGGGEPPFPTPQLRPVTPLFHGVSSLWPPTALYAGVPTQICAGSGAGLSLPFPPPSLPPPSYTRDPRLQKRLAEFHASLVGADVGPKPAPPQPNQPILEEIRRNLLRSVKVEPREEGAFQEPKAPPSEAPPPKQKEGAQKERKASTDGRLPEGRARAANPELKKSKPPAEPPPPSRLSSVSPASLPLKKRKAAHLLAQVQEPAKAERRGQKKGSSVPHPPPNISRQSPAGKKREKEKVAASVPVVKAGKVDYCCQMCSLRFKSRASARDHVVGRHVMMEKDSERFFLARPRVPPPKSSGSGSGAGSGDLERLEEIRRELDELKKRLRLRNMK